MNERDRENGFQLSIYAKGKASNMRRATHVFWARDFCVELAMGVSDCFRYVASNVSSNERYHMQCFRVLGAYGAIYQLKPHDYHNRQDGSRWKELQYGAVPAADNSFSTLHIC